MYLDFEVVYTSKIEVLVVNQNFVGEEDNRRGLVKGEQFGVVAVGKDVGAHQDVIGGCVVVVVAVVVVRTGDGVAAVWIVALCGIRAEAGGRCASVV